MKEEAAAGTNISSMAAPAVSSPCSENPLSPVGAAAAASCSQPVQSFLPAPSLDQSLADIANSTSSKTSVIVSRKDQQQYQKVAAVKEEHTARSFEHTFLMTPRVEESADRSDEDWSGCY